MDLCQFPLAILEEIINKLPSRDVLSLSQTCQIFKDMCSSKQTWCHRARTDFNVVLPCSNLLDLPGEGNAQRRCCTWEKAFYFRLLDASDSRLGLTLRRLWKRVNVRRYGGLVTVVVSERALKFLEWSAPTRYEHLLRPLRSHEICSALLDENFEVHYKIGDQIINGNDGYIFYGSIDLPRNLIYMRMSPIEYSSMDREQREKLEYWCSDNEQHFVSINTNEARQSTRFSPINLGVFKGDYVVRDCQGLTLVALQRNGSHILEAEMITGSDHDFDYNVIAFRIFLHKPITMTKEQQLDYSELSRIYEEERESPVNGCPCASNNGALCTVSTGNAGTYAHTFSWPALDQRSYEGMGRLTDIHECQWRFLAEVRGMKCGGEMGFVRAFCVVFSTELFAIITMQGHGRLGMNLYHYANNNLFTDE